MTPFYADRWFTCYEGDATKVLATLADESVHAVITSPPYWGLRDYDAPGQIGLEPTAQTYVDLLVGVCREIRRVLRADGTFWLVLGDTRTPDKNLTGIPWRVALALQADGWFLRSDIVWAKPNVMPEPVTDRPAKAHEYVFLLSKSPRYFYDAEAVREPAVQPERVRMDRVGGANGADVRHSPGGIANGSETRHLRDVWAVGSEPYAASHFAVFPQRLVVPMIRASTSARGVCSECGAPWERIVEVSPTVTRRSARTHSKGQTRASGTVLKPRSSATVGWRATCAHVDAKTVPATLLDPFAGTGTLGIVARKYLRKSILIDLEASYLRDRLVTRAEDEAIRESKA